MPSLAVVVPVEFAMDKVYPKGLLKVTFFGLWIVGLLCWYMTGSFADDLLLWRERNDFPPKHFSDLIFALISAPVAILLTLALTIDREGPPVTARWGVVWVIVTCAALVFRFRQFLRKHPATTV